MRHDPWSEDDGAGSPEFAWAEESSRHDITKAKLKRAEESLAKIRLWYEGNLDERLIEILDAYEEGRDET